MKLSEITADLGQCFGSNDPDVLGLTCDSREIQPGWVFVALKGESQDGADFIEKALQQGAVAICSDRKLESLSVPCVHFENPRAAMALAARRIYGNPDERLKLLGVTGTNGKTTTALLVRQLLQGSGLGCGIQGTVLLAAGSEQKDATRTSAESPVFYRWMKKGVDAGDAAMVVEVSSHALCLDRVTGARFKASLFSNLTQDHLDFHGDMESYFQAKARLFDQSEVGLINADDPYGARLLKDRRELKSYAIDRPADYQALDLKMDGKGSHLRLKTPNGEYEIQSPLLARFNVYNLLGALALCAEAGFDLQKLLPAVSKLKGAPGRLERVDLGQDFGVMVDYAHTPDALEKLMDAGRAMLAPGARLHVLFGCGGDRDATKRPIMAGAVAKGADVIWHTSDNTRFEDPQQILNDGAKGIPEGILQDPTRYHRIANRAKAVFESIQDCRPGDLLLLAGKGHEPYQDVKGVKHPYSDRQAVELALQGKILPMEEA